MNTPLTRPTIDEFMMGLAMLASQRTTCIRRGVGCVLANKRGHVLSIGYNGVAAGLLHCNDLQGQKQKSGVKISASASLESAVMCLEHNAPHLKGKARGYEFCSNPNSGEANRPDDNGVMWLSFEYTPHACQGHDLPPGQDSCEAVHAEANALLQ